MKRFARLLDQLAFQSQRNAKLRLVSDYFATAPDPDRGYALAALTGDLVFRHAKAGLFRDLAAARTDPMLFGLSYDYVGDLAETVALIWPRQPNDAPPPDLATIVETLEVSPKAKLPDIVADWLDRLDATGRWALIKFVTGGLRIGLSARLAKTAVASLGKIDPDKVEEVWHALEIPYRGLFDWLEGRGPKPEAVGRATFRPPMLAQPLEEVELERLDPAEFMAEWKWDGARVQIVGEGPLVRLYSRSGDEMTAAFPEVVDHAASDVTLDGELLVMRGGEVAPFADLQKRLNRKSLDPKLLRDFPITVRLYDILFEGAEDLRPLPFADRRRRLEAWHAAKPRPGFDLSPLVAFESWEELAEKRAAIAATGVEGLMLKRADSPYLAGRPVGQWYKWKINPKLVDAVLMYAQRGHGKRSSYYSDYTFGLWHGEELVPVGKAYFGFTDQELSFLDRWIRNHTVARFGPVREVEKSLVLEVAFDAVQLSGRHKSG
ncbi:MAG TPA: cisplatin damage response ATP-dependent DNA ligase, partial [Dongiaceae bacterium]|nr:cisplatin damage response ATP-dependent DNA ligase [Dongiaceae bacterium]